MPLSRNLILHGGVGETSFFMDEQEESIEISGPGLELSIGLGFLLDSDSKVNIFNALASTTFISQEYFITSMRLTGFTESRHFSTDDYDFAQKVVELGIPLDYAIRTAYLTSLLEHDKFDAPRMKIIENLKNNKIDIKLENSGTYKGLTTLEIYVLLTLASDAVVADQVLISSLSEPSRMIKSSRALSELISTGALSNVSTPKKLTALLAILSEQFPDRSYSSFQNNVSAFFEILASFTEWQRASQLREEGTELTRNLIEKLATWIGGATRTSNVLIPSEELKSLVSLIEAGYSPEVIEGADEMMKENEKFISISDSRFLVYVTLLDYLKSGGSADDPINWVLATQPLLDMDLVLKG